MAFILVKMPFITYHLRMSFAENLRDELEYQGMQVKELAEKTGLSINTLNKYRPGSKVVPTIDNALKIARVLNVSLDYLATGKFMAEKHGGRNEILQIYKRMRKFSDSDIRTVKSVVDSLSEKYK
ncbi:MAG: helix-turn-helix domain-containing protein [Treponemataceae bacterium]|nr:helix-turn-helix domain-containing protein [Treponemataceae bacterium]